MMWFNAAGKPLSFISKVVSESLAGFLVIFAVVVFAVDDASAQVDFSPWQNPAGANMGVDPDIAVCDQPVAGQLCEISVEIFNRGELGAISLAEKPIEVLFVSGPTVLGTVSLPEGTLIDAGGSLVVPLDWTPQAGQTQLEVFVDPSNLWNEDDEANNGTTRNVTVEQPVVDLTPWLNPAGENNNGSPPPYDIETCASPTEGVPCNVTVTITNLGNAPVTSTTADPVEIRVVTNLVLLDTLEFPDGTTISPGDSQDITFEWIPALGHTELAAFVDPSGAIDESEEANNVTFRPVVVNEASIVPVFFCEFESPGDQWLVKLPVLVVVRLTDITGEVVARHDLPRSANGRLQRPLAELTCGSKSNDHALIFVPGSRRHPVNLWTTVISSGKKASEGLCSIDVFSGNEDAYTLDPVSCHTEYEAVKKIKPKRGR